MKEKKHRRWFVLLIILVVVLVGVVIAIIISTKPTPVALFEEFGVGMLLEEAETMNECAECHNSADFHTCETCHDDHGAVELADVMFFEVVELTGDVPDPSFVRVNEILPDQNNRGTHITLFEFLENHGIEEFESVTFTTNDGGLTTIESQYLDETAMLVPYMDGVRFITESVHSSTWLKGIQRITVVGNDHPLTIDGYTTSIGRLLLEDTVRLTVEGSDVMLSDENGKTSHAFVANWVEGARLIPLLQSDPSQGITVTDADGAVTILAYDEIADAVIAIVRDEVTLILTDRGRSAWPTRITKIEVNQ